MPEDEDENFDEDEYNERMANGGEDSDNENKENF
jgi:hypothetical protein